ncbi:MAG: 2,3-diphosphoglycerate synthetase [Gaiella sp.]
MSSLHGLRTAVAVIDGEHYAPVVRDALRELPDLVLGAVLVGGTEKLRGGEDYGVPLCATLEEAIAEHDPDVVLDLSDEPVLGPAARLELAGRALAAGVAYEGADFRFDPPVLAESELATLAVVGTGKRVGKTAVTGHVARLLARRRRIVVLAMGRGGPARPEVVRIAPTVDDLVALSRAGRHAASDHLETAAVAGVETIGCRRCGGGLAGAVVLSNVDEGLELARRLDPELLVLDGSGAASPPVAAGRRVLVVSAHQGPELAAGYLNGYRVRLADLVVVTMAEDGTPHAAVARAVATHVRDDVPVVRAVLRPRPLEAIAGERVAYFGTAPDESAATIARHLSQRHGADVAAVSGSLSDRTALRAELDRIDAATFVVELKAAAVDVVVEEALRRDVRVVLATCDVEPLPGEAPLDAALEQLAAEAVAIRSGALA